MSEEAPQQAPPPEGAPAAPPAPETPPVDWSPFQHAGLTPDQFQNPYELRERYQFVESLRDPGRRPWAMTQALAMEPELQGLDWQEARQHLIDLAQRRQDPFYGTEPGNPAEGGEPDMSDPRVMQAIRGLYEQVQQMQQQQTQERTMGELVQGVESLRTQHSLSEEQTQALGQLALAQQQFGLPPQQAVQAAWSVLDKARNAWLQNAVAQQEGIPQTTHRPGAPPATDQTPTSVESALDMLFGPKG